MKSQIVGLEREECGSQRRAGFESSVINWTVEVEAPTRTRPWDRR
jgi:hypothetical protein